jgi:hypothetical protein
MRARAVAGLLVALALVASSVSPVGAGGSRPAPGFADGEWIGDMVSGFGFTVEGGVGGSSGGGVFSLRVEGGSITAGSYEASAVGTFVSALGPGSSAEGTLTAAGAITGAADEPIIENVTAKISATITVGGVSLPFEQDLGGDSLTMTILSATCSVVIGTAEPEVRARVEGSVGITNLSSRFVATRLRAGGDRAEDLSTEVVSLIVEGDAVVADAADGTIDVGRFLDLLLRAERLAESIPRNERCAGSGPTDHLSTVASVVANLLEVIIANPDAFGAVELQVALEAAVRAGLAGPDGRPDLLGDMRDIVGDRIDTAAAAGDDVSVGRLAAAANMMSWRSEAAAAAAHLSGGGG